MPIKKNNTRPVNPLINCHHYPTNIMYTPYKVLWAFQDCGVWQGNMLDNEDSGKCSRKWKCVKANEIGNVTLREYSSELS